MANKSLQPCFCLAGVTLDIDSGIIGARSFQHHFSSNYCYCCTNFVLFTVDDVVMIVVSVLSQMADNNMIVNNMIVFLSTMVGHALCHHVEV